MSKDKNTSTNAAMAQSAARHAYETSVTSRALQRAGNNPQLKGIVHEVMVADKMNASLGRILSGQKTAMTKSATAGTVDLVTTQAGKVVERLQLKDVLSDGQVRKVAREIAGGKYHSAQILGTTESAAKLNNALARTKSAKQVLDSGISSETTTRLAWQAGARGSGSLAATAKNAALVGGKGGAVVGAGIEAVSGLVDLIDGKRDLAEVTVDVGVAAAKGYVVGAVSSAALSTASSIAAPMAGGAASAAVGSAIGLGSLATGIASCIPGGVIAAGLGLWISSWW
jgi:hypothetical protein